MVDYPASNLCPNCGGNGLDGVDFCLPCNGTGFVSSQGESLYRKGIQEAVVLPTNVFRSHEVEPCLDGTEYNALTDAQKEGVKIILSCGRVDLSDGASTKTRLWNWFGAESTTVANLTTLLG